MNDTSWRNLSAILGLACVVMIIAAGALLMTSGEAAATPSAQATEIASIDQPTASMDESNPPESPDASGSGEVAASPTVGPATSPSIQTNAPINTVTFNNLQLDSQNDPLGHPRTFTFITDGFGKIGASFTTVAPASALSSICLSFDGGKPTCVRSTHYAFTKAATDTAHSVWVVSIQGYQGNRPTVNVSMSWPSNKPRVTLSHGRFQGSSSPGVPESLNGFTATVTPKFAGTVGLSAAWTSITTDARVTIDQAVGSTSSLLDQKAYTGVQNLGSPGYSYAVTAGRAYRLSLRNLSSDSGRPDLTATISLPSAS